MRKAQSNFDSTCPICLEVMSESREVAWSLQSHAVMYSITIVYRNGLLHRMMTAHVAEVIFVISMLSN